MGDMPTLYVYYIAYRYRGPAELRPLRKNKEIQSIIDPTMSQGIWLAWSTDSPRGNSLFGVNREDLVRWIGLWGIWIRSPGTK